MELRMQIDPAWGFNPASVSAVATACAATVAGYAYLLSVKQRRREFEDQQTRQARLVQVTFRYTQRPSPLSEGALHQTLIVNLFNGSPLAIRPGNLYVRAENVSRSIKRPLHGEHRERTRILGWEPYKLSATRWRFGGTVEVEWYFAGILGEDLVEPGAHVVVETRVGPHAEDFRLVRGAGMAVSFTDVNGRGWWRRGDGLLVADRMGKRVIGDGVRGLRGPGPEELRDPQI
ncbi:hypothetical protein [Phycicoccus avicenniae]|uniref:hypothetical protein n=1 Tax=Phycicoccus avicenniae TaxID=2828860 RepID=UPI003D2D3944